MLEIEYTASPNEIAKATVDFMSNRPGLSIMIFLMRAASICLLIGFLIAWHNDAARQKDCITAAISIMFLLFYKPLNRWLIKSIFHLRKFNDIKYLFKMDEQSILYKLHTYEPQNIQWKKLKYVLQNQDGYIIPLTGLENAGKFLWIPQRCLHHANDESAFLNLLTRFKLKVIKIK